MLVYNQEERNIENHGFCFCLVSKPPSPAETSTGPWEVAAEKASYDEFLIIILSIFLDGSSLKKANRHFMFRVFFTFKSVSYRYSYS